MRSFAHMLKVTAFAAIGGLLASTAGAQTVLKASHQFPGGKGDIRDIGLSWGESAARTPTP